MLAVDPCMRQWFSGKIRLCHLHDVAVPGVRFPLGASFLLRFWIKFGWWQNGLLPMLCDVCFAQIDMSTELRNAFGNESTYMQAACMLWQFR